MLKSPDTFQSVLRRELPFGSTDAGSIRLEISTNETQAGVALMVELEEVVSRHCAPFASKGRGERVPCCGQIDETIPEV